MRLLLPHHCKKIGIVMAPLGACLWILMQRGYIEGLLVSLFGEQRGPYQFSVYHIMNVIAAVMGFFSFLAGLYFIAFSKEKLEDEMVQKTRLDSFQFAAFIQIICMIAGFLYMLFAGDPGEAVMMLFFAGLFFLFWLTFIGRFNYMLHVKFKP